MIICDLCGKQKDCLRREIEDKEYDICPDCWNPFAQKLAGKGRETGREIVLLPPPHKEREDEPPAPLPGEPPEIWGAANYERTVEGAPLCRELLSIPQ